MATYATGSVTKYNKFVTLDGTDVAGHNSINDVFNAIDVAINNSMTGMIVLVASSWTSPTDTSGNPLWKDYTTANGYTNVPSPPNAYHKYIIKV